MKDLTSPRGFCSQFIQRKAQRAEWGLDRSFLLMCILSRKKTCVCVCVCARARVCVSWEKRDGRGMGIRKEVTELD